MPAATQIWSHTFNKAYDALPVGVRVRVGEAIDSLGRELAAVPHHRLKGTDAFRLRVGDYRVVYDFDLKQQRVDLLFVGHRRDIYKVL
ncbi:MAG: type II toxin-antitoxin system RelE/ParE family toxin [Chthoniobacterales bacterium]